MAGHAVQTIRREDTEDVILMGDFNARDVDWENEVAISPSGRLLLDTVKENMLFQLVREQTHGHNILDLVITGNPDTRRGRSRF